MEFLSELSDMDKKARGVNMTLLAKKKVMSTPEAYRDLILTMDLAAWSEQIAPDDLVDAVKQIVPDEEQMTVFMAHFADKKWKLIDAKYFAFGEKLWFYCRRIPLVGLRCNLWSFKMAFQEMCDDQYAFINALRVCQRCIAGNAKMLRVFQLILAIGNYLNHGNKRTGGAKGVRLDIFDKLRGLGANKPTSEEERLNGASEVCHALSTQNLENV